MRIDFVNGLAQKLSIQRRDLIEKDVILHQVLSDLSKDGFFSKSFAFKGGTCLIKCYYGYLRLSEDIDEADSCNFLAGFEAFLKKVAGELTVNRQPRRRL